MTNLFSFLFAKRLTEVLVAASLFFVWWRRQPGILQCTGVTRRRDGPPESPGILQVVVLGRAGLSSGQDRCEPDNPTAAASTSPWNLPSHRGAVHPVHLNLSSPSHAQNESRAHLSQCKHLDCRAAMSSLSFNLGLPSTVISVPAVPRRSNLNNRNNTLLQSMTHQGHGNTPFRSHSISF